MNTKAIGLQTRLLAHPVVVAGAACVVGQKEGEGPLRKWFDKIGEDSYFGQESWEKAESTMLRESLTLACDKAKLAPSDLDYVLSGDLLNQCISSNFALRDMAIPYFGLYGACSTMAEALCLGSMLIDGGFADHCAAMASSHFCSAERQFRTPLEYGGQRTPTAQWTVTGAGALIMASGGHGPRITHVTVGHIVDPGIKDVSNMGACMAPAAYDTLSAHFRDTGRTPEDYDAIITGDLGKVGHKILTELFARDGVDLGICSTDCGMLIYDSAAQDVHAGGSGAGCCASVLCGHILQRITRGDWKRVLFAATGALMSSTSSMQGESIPGICHAVVLESEDGRE